LFFKNKAISNMKLEPSSSVPASDTKDSSAQEDSASLTSANRQQAEIANKLAEQYLIQGDVLRAEKLLQKGYRMCPTERARELLTEIVTGRDEDRAAGRTYQGRRGAVDGVIRSTIQQSMTLKLDDKTVDYIVKVCDGMEERGAEVFAELEHNPDATQEQVINIVQGLQVMWNRASQQAASHGHSHNGVACGGHGHSHSGGDGDGDGDGGGGFSMSDDPHGVNTSLVGLASAGGIIGLLAHTFGSRMPIVAVLAPIGSMSCVLLTVLTAYYLWRTGDNIRDPRVIFPAISELGAAMPEQRVYQVGFAITGLLLMVHIRLFSQLVVPKLLEYGNSEMQNHADLAISWGYYSAAGVILQGLFTLEMKMSMQSMVHWGGAVLFMSGAMNHAQNSKSLYESALQYSDNVEVLRNESLLNAVYVRKLILDYSSFVMFVPIILAQVFFASSSGTPPPPARRLPNGQEEPQMPDPKTMNTMGVMQWAIVLQFAVYFCTYAVDLYVCVSDSVDKPGWTIPAFQKNK
jgi:hypothetical protein